MGEVTVKLSIAFLPSNLITGCPSEYCRDIGRIAKGKYYRDKFIIMCFGIIDLLSKYGTFPLYTQASPPGSDIHVMLRSRCHATVDLKP
jgi:hypothetical protein